MDYVHVHVYVYPPLVQVSWDSLVSPALPRFISGSTDGLCTCTCVCNPSPPRPSILGFPSVPYPSKVHPRIGRWTMYMCMYTPPPLVQVSWDSLVSPTLPRFIPGSADGLCTCTCFTLSPHPSILGFPSIPDPSIVHPRISRWTIYTTCTCIYMYTLPCPSILGFQVIPGFATGLYVHVDEYNVPLVPVQHFLVYLCLSAASIGDSKINSAWGK